MGWGTIGGMIGGSIGSAISNALKGNSNKPNNSGSGSSSGSGYIKPNNTGGVSGRVPSVSGGSSISSGSQSSFGGSGGGSSGSFGGGFNYGDPNKVDYSALFQNSVANGAGADQLQSILDDRRKKTTIDGYSQYASDDFDAKAQAYIDSLRTRPYEKPFQDSGFQSQLEQMQQDNNAATQAAIAQGKLSLQQQLPGIQQSYDEAARQAYIQMMNARKDLPQQLAAAGISGQGAAESTISNQTNAYQNVLSQSEQARRNAEQQIQNQISNLEATGNLQYAQNASDISKLTFQAYQNYLQQQQQQADADRQFALQVGGLMGSYGGVPTFDNQKWQDEKNQSAQAQAYDQYMQRYQQAFQRWSMLGTVANEADAAILGIPIGTAHADERYRRAELALNQYLAHRQ